MMYRLWDMRLTLASAVLTGWLAYPLLVQLPTVYDFFFPVVTMQATLVSQQRDSVTLHIEGEKHRSCRFLQLDSYYQTVTGVMVDADEMRLDGPAKDGSNKPTGRFDLGTWRIFPAPQDRARRILMYVEHDCLGRLVTTQIADIELEVMK